MARACFALGVAITALQAAVVLLLIWRSDGWTAHPLGRTVPEAASARPADDDEPVAISVMRLAMPDRSTSSPNLTTHVVLCPLYSGPGYDAKRHASREVTLPAFEAPLRLDAAAAHALRRGGTALGRPPNGGQRLPRGLRDQPAVPSRLGLGLGLALTLTLTLR